ncbi:serine-threonine protein kinase [Streptomyces ficellus]|uniref:Serine-threonine protein kinase n=1 Tax=Streptomyces ficellus TaxID=1977088 RepID=A0ABT7Z231_9ACTN|nr:serine-threonine protein kinase [Streptomyces ficellus]MDN3293553.1 serine-threonine protein kinase [Streptomyces ficellus]
MTGMSVRPYQEITFDKDGDVNAAQRDALARLDVTDLVMFAHGWNSSTAVSARLYSRFLAPFPDLLGDAARARLGYAGIVWPSMRFADEPVPDFERAAAVAGAVAGPGLDEETVRALMAAFPGREAVVERLAWLLAEQPDDAAAFDAFGSLVRELVAAPVAAPVAGAAADPGEGATAGPVAGATGVAADLGEGGDPAFLREDTVSVCAQFTAALDGSPVALGRGLKRLWKGAKEVLRQAAYWEMKRRSGTVGERGLGPLLGHLARSSPRVRVHLVGHSQGARLVSFALRGLPEGVRNVKSVTLLQGAFSHYVFATRLPHGLRGAGALGGLQRRVDGPVVACYSRHDTALGVIYPLAARLAGDATSLIRDERWWAMGHDGIQAVDGTPRLTLDAALARGLPASGCVNVDAASVVRRGGPPTGAHSDICHPELARVVIAAGRIG